MKKLHVLIYILIVILPSIVHTRLIEIITENGTPVHISDTETVQNFFDKCRKDRYCTNNNKLVLDFNDKLIKEGSPEAKRTLWDHSSLFSNRAVVAILQYPQQQFATYHPYQKSFIEIEAPNGKIKKCSINETPAHFFRSCRNSGNCINDRPLTLKFDFFEIKEGTQDANRPFGSFGTYCGFAQARYR